MSQWHVQCWHYDPVKKEWGAATIDDYIPVLPNDPVRLHAVETATWPFQIPFSAKPQANEVWVILLAIAERVLPLAVSGRGTRDEERAIALPSDCRWALKSVPTKCSVHLARPTERTELSTTS